MTTAKVEHRDYVPYGYIGLTYCNVNFFGDKAYKFDSEWRSIRHQNITKIEKHQSYSLQRQEKLIKDYKSQRQNLYKQLPDKKWWHFWKSKEEKAILNDIYKLNKKINDACIELEKMKKPKKLNVYREVAEIESFLKSKGFIMRHRDSGGKTGSDITDIWELV